jgi:phage shock protein C
MRGQRVLHRSENGKIAGVCAGIAEYLGWPPFRVRLVYVLVSLASVAFPGMLVYCVLWFLMPGPND